MIIIIADECSASTCAYSANDAVAIETSNAHADSTSPDSKKSGYRSKIMSFLIWTFSADSSHGVESDIGLGDRHRADPTAAKLCPTIANATSSCRHTCTQSIHRQHAAEQFPDGLS